MVNPPRALPKSRTVRDPAARSAGESSVPANPPRKASGLEAAMERDEAAIWPDIHISVLPGTTAARAESRSANASVQFSPVPRQSAPYRTCTTFAPPPLPKKSGYSPDTVAFPEADTSCAPSEEIETDTSATIPSGR